MRVFISSRGVPIPQNPLNGIFELDQARALQKAGVEVVLIVLDFRSILRRRRWGFYKSTCDGITCFHISFPLGNLEIPIFNFISRKLTKVGAIMIKKRLGTPDILHSHFLPISFLSTVLQRVLCAPLIMTEHSSLVNHEKLEPSVLKMGKQTYPFAKRVIAVSDALRKKLKAHFGVEAIILNNIIDSDVFRYDPIKYNKARNEFIFVSVGNLNHNKGFDILIEAFAKANLADHVKLFIVGAGELNDKLQKMAQQFGVKDSVIFKGELNRAEIASIYRNADAFVLASRGETFGVVYVEAIMAGLPAIATKCGGPEEFINKQNGILVPPEKIDELSAAISYMVKNTDKFDRNLISKDSITKFSGQTIARKLLNVYSQVQIQSLNTK